MTKGGTATKLWLTPHILETYFSWRRQQPTSPPSTPSSPSLLPLPQPPSTTSPACTFSTCKNNRIKIQTKQLSICLKSSIVECLWPSIFSPESSAKSKNIACPSQHLRYWRLPEYYLYTVSKVARPFIKRVIRIYKSYYFQILTTCIWSGKNIHFF